MAEVMASLPPMFVLATLGPPGLPARFAPPPCPAPAVTGEKEGMHIADSLASSEVVP